LAANYKEMALPLRLLGTAVKYRASGGDRRVLLGLPLEERKLLAPIVLNLTKADDIDRLVDALIERVDRRLGRR
jgi:hypothetical protein